MNVSATYSAASSELIGEYDDLMILAIVGKAGSCCAPVGMTDDAGEALERLKAFLIEFRPTSCVKSYVVYLWVHSCKTSFNEVSISSILDQARDL